MVNLSYKVRIGYLGKNVEIRIWVLDMLFINFIIMDNR